MAVFLGGGFEVAMELGVGVRGSWVGCWWVYWCGVVSFGNDSAAFMALGALIDR